LSGAALYKVAAILSLLHSLAVAESQAGRMAATHASPEVQGFAAELMGDLPALDQEVRELAARLRLQLRSRAAPDELVGDGPAFDRGLLALVERLDREALAQLHASRAKGEPALLFARAQTVIGAHERRARALLRARVPQARRRQSR
jgi:hypothetical protein